MTEEAVCVGVDVAKGTLDLAVSNSTETRQFENNHEGITSAASYIAGLKPTVIILEATGHFEMPLAAVLQTNHLPVVEDKNPKKLIGLIVTSDIVSVYMD